jgi:hypothetical protein
MILRHPWRKKQKEQKMGIFNLSVNDYVPIKLNEKKIKLIKTGKWNMFGKSILDLGEIGKKTRTINSLCAIFDLEGFTHFCSQIDPQLAIPIFLDEYIKWFFDTIKQETKQKGFSNGIKVWHRLPFYAKFMGDGFLFLWNIENTGPISQKNIIQTCSNICCKYIDDFYPAIRKKVSDAPKKLRCGIVKGNVYTVGNGNDFIGPCINNASRLQKLPGISISFSNRGFIFDDEMSAEINQTWIEKKVFIRGIGDAELVYIMRKEYSKMTQDEKANYKRP